MLLKAFISNMERIPTEIHLRLFTSITIKKVAYLSLVLVSDVAPHSVPVVDYHGRGLFSNVYKKRIYRLQALNDSRRQNPENTDGGKSSLFLQFLYSY